MEDCENALSDKVSTSEIETKLQHQFEKIIEYLNKAMDLVENDEKDTGWKEFSCHVEKNTHNYEAAPAVIAGIRNLKIKCSLLLA